MEFLKSKKTDLCLWLSKDPEYIIEKCEDILSVKQGKAVSNQATVPAKICLLLDTIMEKGECACVEFHEILKKEQARYPDLQQHFSKCTQVSSSPTVYADCNSTVDMRKVTKVRTKKDLIMHKTFQSGGMNLSGSNQGQTQPRADVVATNNSHVSAEVIKDCEVGGNLDMSWTQTPAPAPVRQASQCPGPSEPKKTKFTKPPLPLQGPAMRKITENKVDLIDWLRSDPSFILQHLHCKGIIKDREYQSLMSVPEPEDKVIKLIDKILGKKETTGLQFLDTLKESDVNDTYPQLQQWITTLGLPEQQDNLPQDWQAMPATNSVRRYQIQPGSTEHGEVLRLFRASCPGNTIIEIERIQNPNLWKNFQIKKQDIDGRNDGMINERRLFHATSHTTIGHINDHGFNRSYAGKNDALYGRGTYFAVNASYSADDKYSKPDGEGRKFMYLCRVLTGHFTQGKEGMLEPPLKGDSTIRRHDSTTNDPSDPTEFVVFHDCQAYPEYLITFLGV
ncbi:uncharacterized protein LOC121536483 isoform X1 [Coregonus clupeaformis]|uniref:uncharacterized protein LOC121536483 isoform X1 n=1 Tax=Coregonus clupeaformis TaxID=59861 RepID=UPI001E1C3254|nr:uncharacterized protein LOC121536483 isoform X1 [Coregonus clupeaformis]XP_045062687.1 uncharacterized protein LOC121536483 isoform X1 [Coregonus clupeaformis]